MTARRWAAWAAGFAVLAVFMGAVVVAVLVVQVHEHYGEWGLAPSSRPPKLVYAGREYRRAGAAGGVAPGEALLDHVAGGELYGPRNALDDPPVLELRTPQGVVRYSLVGGP